eukprot:m.138798 g.138798  ORF g.138798 m.138798 type:complete len:144 (-) comp30015_c1_seq1:68-499(-)
MAMMQRFARFASQRVRHTQIARLSSAGVLQSEGEGQFKAMILLKKKPEMTKEEFKTWWLGQHAALALQLPKLRKYAINIVDAVEGQESVCDGIAELWFDEEKDLGDAYLTEIGKSVAADSMAIVAGRERLLTKEFVFEPTPQQ